MYEIKHLNKNPTKLILLFYTYALPMNVKSS